MPGITIMADNDKMPQQGGAVGPPRKWGHRMTVSAKPAALKTPAALPVGDATLHGFSGCGMKRTFNMVQADPNVAPAPQGGG